MATPFDEIKSVLTTLEENTGPAGVIFAGINNVVPEESPVPLPGGGNPQVPDEVAFLQPFVDAVANPANAVAAAMMANAAFVTDRAGEYRTTIEGFQDYIPSGGDQKLEAFRAEAEATLAAESARFAATATTLLANTGTVVGEYTTIAGDQFASSSAAALAALATGTDTAVETLDLVVARATQDSGTAEALQAEFFETVGAITDGQEVLAGSADAFTEIVSGIADEVAQSGVPDALTNLGQAVADGVTSLGESVRDAGIALFDNGGGVPNLSVVPEGLVNIASALSEAALGDEGVVTTAGGAAAGVLDGATAVGVAAIGTAEGVVVDTVLAGIENDLVPALFEVPAAIADQLSGGDPASPFNQIRDGIEENAPVVQGAVSTVAGTASDGAGTAFGGATDGLGTVSSTFTTGFETVTGAATLVIGTVVTTISSAEFPPGAPDFPPELPRPVPG